MEKLEELNKILHKLRTYTEYESLEAVNNDIDKAIRLVEEMKNEAKNNNNNASI